MRIKFSFSEQFFGLCWTAPSLLPPSLLPWVSLFIPPSLAFSVALSAPSQSAMPRQLVRSAVSGLHWALWEAVTQVCYSRRGAAHPRVGGKSRVTLGPAQPGRNQICIPAETGKRETRHWQENKAQWQWEISERRRGKVTNPDSCCWCCDQCEQGRTQVTEQNLTPGCGGWGITCLTVWRLWEWAPISSMMSPVVGHACCARRAPSFRGWTPSPGRAVPVFSVSEVLFDFSRATQSCQSLPTLSHTQTHACLFLLLACFPPSGLSPRGSCHWLQSGTGKDCDRLSPLFSFLVFNILQNSLLRYSL